MDVLITTPGRIATILRTKKSGNLDLTNVQSIVLDEVDILLIDENFGPQLRTVGAATASSSSTQFVFVTATCRRRVRDVFGRGTTRYYEALVVQLACVLVLRQELAMEHSYCCHSQHERSPLERSEKDDDDPLPLPPLSYAQQQEIVPVSTTNRS